MGTMMEEFCILQFLVTYKPLLQIYLFILVLNQTQGLVHARQHPASELYLQSWIYF